MTLYNLVNSMTIQGNVTIKVFDKDSSEKECYVIRDVDDLAYVYDYDEVEDLEISFMYVSKSCDGTPWLNIEVVEE